MFFTGEYRHSLDAKGRLIVPSRVREALEGEEVTLTVWPDGCISLWNGAYWAKLGSDLLEQEKKDPKKRAAIRKLFANAFTDEVDKQGRITVPPHLRTFAGIDRDVVVSGAGDHVEIWDPRKYEQSTGTAEQGFDEVFAELDL